MHTGLGLGLSGTTQHFLESQAATVAGVLREEAAANRKLRRFKEQRRQQEGPEEVRLEVGCVVAGGNV